jgi:phospholipid/cholesterol/gamma-HCH transport system ATP-binding protein
MIEIRELSKHFNNHQVLNRLSLNIEKGQTCVIIGRSGCGKSVLLKHIVGLLNPDEGSVLVEGKGWLN